MKKLIMILLLFMFVWQPAYTQASEPTVEREIVGYKKVYKTYKKKVQKKTYLGRFRITHYCSCVRCCGKWSSSKTASGRKAKAGRTVAVNRRLIRFGTKLKIDGHIYTAEDTGGFDLYTIDIFCSSHREALRRGVKHRKVYKVKTVTVKKKKVIKKPIYKVVE